MQNEILEYAKKQARSKRTKLAWKQAKNKGLKRLNKDCFAPKQVVFKREIFGSVAEAFRGSYTYKISREHAQIIGDLAGLFSVDVTPIQGGFEFYLKGHEGWDEQEVSLLLDKTLNVKAQWKS